MSDEITSQTIKGKTPYELTSDMIYKLSSNIGDKSSILKYIGNGVALVRLYNKYPIVYDDLLDANTVDELVYVLMKVSKGLVEISSKLIFSENSDEKKTALACNNSIKAIEFLMTLLQTGEAVFEYSTDEKEEADKTPEEGNDKGKADDRDKTNKKNKKISVKFKIEYNGERTAVIKLPPSSQIEIVRALVSVIIIEASQFAVSRALSISGKQGNSSNTGNSGGVS